MKILLTFKLPKEYLNEVDNKYQFEYTQDLETISLKSYEGIICHNQIKINSTIIDKCSNLKIISNFGAGYDNIDIEYARKKNIVVTNTPNAVTDSTAEIAIGLMIDVMRKISFFDRKLRNNDIGKWYQKKNYGVSLSGKTLGIIGMGRIGKAIAKRAYSFGMKIIYYKRERLDISEEKKINALYHPLNFIFSNSDIISVNVPLNYSTYHMIGIKEISLMKKTSFIINTSRGSVIKEDDLIRCLKKRDIAGAGLDVFENEPNINNAFKELENVVLTPHIGTDTHETEKLMAREAIGNIINYFSCNSVANRVV